MQEELLVQDKKIEELSKLLHEGDHTVLESLVEKACQDGRQELRDALYNALQAVRQLTDDSAVLANCVLNRQRHVVARVR